MTAEHAGGAPDLGRSLDDLEGARPSPGPDATRLVATAHALHRLPLRDLGAEGLRLLIGQNVGLRFLVPVAPDLLEVDPAAEGDLGPGDLLAALAGRPAEFWAARPGLAARPAAVSAAARRATGPDGLS
ncbi:contact-dependent growth inhibition system immunity protein [Kitasatospora sp. KL5]|uniref:contact-dependent growth inhibition system immunity protein n=1 Tax=Kitasatospora sp. KL5 TaxID=3425125 RepID=UPI003D6F0A41